MKKKSENLFVRKARNMCFCTFESPDPTIVTEPGQSQSVKKLYEDFVLGRLDPSQIGGQPQYDSPEGMITEDLDPFNSFGMTLEQVDALRQHSERQVREGRKNAAKKGVANAEPDAMQPEQEKKNENAKQNEGGDD